MRQTIGDGDDIPGVVISGLSREAHIITRTKPRRRGCPNSQSKPALILIGKAKKEKETLMTEFNREEAIADIL
jgi:hypothetical protein